MSELEFFDTLDDFDLTNEKWADDCFEQYLNSF
jgi:hypothetical protein